MSRSGRYVFLALSVLFVLAVLEQVFLAGLGLFRSSGVWEIHVGIGHMVVFVPFAMLLVSWVFHLGRRSVQYSALLLLGTTVQTSVFAVLKGAAPVLAAFHPVLAVLLFAGGGLVVWYAWALVRGSVKVADVVVPAARECAPSGEGLAAC